MTLFKKIMIFLLLVFAVIQFIRPQKNKGNVLPPGDIKFVVSMPDTVKALLKSSCYDCHSNNTAYPWYAEVQPVGWWLSSHIKDGKRALNFNEFGSYSISRQRSKLKSIAHEIHDNGMPLLSYTLIHRYAKLTEAQKKYITEWASGLSESLSTQK